MTTLQCPHGYDECWNGCVYPGRCGRFKRAAELFPHSPEMQRKWVEARCHADSVAPRYGLMVPWDVRQLQHTEAQFTPRTLKEARLT